MNLYRGTQPQELHDISLQDCEFCKEKTWHENGVCENADTHPKEKPAPQQSQDASK